MDKFEQEFADLRKENDEFVQLVAHDLKAPVRKLGTFINRLITKSKVEWSDESKPYIEKIERTLDNLNEIIDRLSEFASMDNQPSVLSELKLGEVIEECMDDIKKSGADEPVLEVSLLPPVKANRNEMKLLFAELIKNAITFKQQHEDIFIRIYSCTSSQTGQVKIIVKDNGIGFDALYKEKIFRPFYRLHGKSEYPGNGLGLAIAGKIMMKNNGTIHAEVSDTRGAKFILTFSEPN